MSSVNVTEDKNKRLPLLFYDPNLTLPTTKQTGSDAIQRMGVGTPVTNDPTPLPTVPFFHWQNRELAPPLS